MRNSIDEVRTSVHKKYISINKNQAHPQYHNPFLSIHVNIDRHKVFPSTCTCTCCGQHRRHPPPAQQTWCTPVLASRPHSSHDAEPPPHLHSSHRLPSRLLVRSLCETARMGLLSFVRLCNSVEYIRIEMLTGDTLIEN